MKSNNGRKGKLPKTTPGPDCVLYAENCHLPPPREGVSLSATPAGRRLRDGAVLHHARRWRTRSRPRW